MQSFMFVSIYNPKLSTKFLGTKLTQR